MTKLFSLFSFGDVYAAPHQKIIPAEDFATLLNLQELVDKTEQLAIQFKKDATEEAEKIKEHAFQEGFQEGLHSLNRHIVSLDHELKKIRDDVHKKILPLAIKAARKILGEELKLHPDRIVDIILTSLKPVTQHRKIVLYVNRNDLAEVEANRPKIKALFDHLDSFAIQERDDIEQGGCMIETEAGIINAQLENQWRALELAFESFMKNP